MNKFKLRSKACYRALRSNSTLRLNNLSLAFLFLIFLFSCGPSYEQMKEDQYRAQSKLIADSVNAFMPGLSSDTIDGITHDFIKTADLKLRVKDVLITSDRIEDFTKAFGGYISSSQLSSEVYSVTSVRTKKDSVLQSRQFTRLNTISLRVPNKQLDSLLRRISTLAEFIDHRSFNCDDVKLKLLANHKNNLRLQSFQSRIKKHIGTKSAKLSEVAAVEASLLTNQESGDQQEIASYELSDQVNYSTLTIQLYQAPQLDLFLLAEPLPPPAYEPGLSEQINTAFLHGLLLLQSCFIFVINYWGLWLFLILLFMLLKKMPVFHK